MGMKQTIVVKLAPTADQHRALLATMERFNQACDHIAEVAFERRLANKIALQKLVYYEIRKRFGLSSQLTVRAIAKVVEAYKRDRSVRPGFRPHGAVCYDQRIMSWRGVEEVSLLTLDGRELIPVRFGAYQAARLDRRQGQADLVLKDGVFYLYVTIDTPQPPPGEPDDYLGLDLGIVNLQRKATKAARRKLRQLGRRRSRYQRNENHRISKTVVRNAIGTQRGIALEDLKGIRDRVTVTRRQRARHGNWSFNQLRSFIDYKAKLHGVRVVAVDPRNTSRTCPDCGHCAKANRPTRNRFRCQACGLAAPADQIAARNIRARAAVMRPNEGAALKVSDTGQAVA